MRTYREDDMACISVAFGPFESRLSLSRDFVSSSSSGILPFGKCKSEFACLQKYCSHFSVSMVLMVASHCVALGWESTRLIQAAVDCLAKNSKRKVAIFFHLSDRYLWLGGRKRRPFHSSGNTMHDHYSEPRMYTLTSLAPTTNIST